MKLIRYKNRKDISSFQREKMWVNLLNEKGRLAVEGLSTTSVCCTGRGLLEGERKTSWYKQ